ncbi:MULTISPECIES: hypothetical protein [Petrimonas]|uniref:hypothetical protein n=1 Tax=Petrimonas TaxID=307628 RepID=UPI0012B5D4C4|nr:MULTISPECIES: hypothetical protein [Petrimonas]
MYSQSSGLTLLLLLIEYRQYGSIIQLYTCRMAQVSIVCFMPPTTSRCLAVASGVEIPRLHS